MKLLKFGATWCGSCKKLSKMIKESRLDEEITVMEIDIEERGDMADDYNVRNLPTLILVTDEGEVICRWSGVGSDTIAKVREKLNNLKH